MQEGMVNIIFDTNAARDFVTGVKLEGLAAFAKNMSLYNKRVEIDDFSNRHYGVALSFK